MDLFVPESFFASPELLAASMVPKSGANGSGLAKT
jgi:hypothetical protein